MEPTAAPASSNRESRRTRAQLNLGLAAGLLATMAGHAAMGQDAPEEVTLVGTVRDFLSSHPDFQVVPAAGFGHYAGNIHEWLPTGYQRPVFIDQGYKVATEWTDQAGRPIAPHLAGAGNGIGGEEALGIRVRHTIELKDENPIDGFNSNYGPYGVAGNFGGDALVSTNSVAAGSIDLDSSAYIRGDVFVGPGGSPSSVITGQGIITGLKAPLEEPYDIPEIVLPENDEDGNDLMPFIPSLTINGTMTLTGDTNPDDDVEQPAMWVGSLTVNPNAILIIQGDLRIRVDGPLNIDKAQVHIAPEANLAIYVSGDVRITNDALVNTNPGVTTHMAINAVGPGLMAIDHDSHVYATIVAADRRLRVAHRAHFYGSFVGDALELEKDGSAVHVDNGNALLGYQNYALTLRDKIEVEKNSEIDSFDSTLGPYGGTNVGANALVTTNTTKHDKVKVHDGSTIHGDVLVGPNANPGSVIDVDSSSTITGSTGVLNAPIAIPVITAPFLGESVGHLHWEDGGEYTINADLRCKHLKLDNGTIVYIDGAVTIRCDDKVELKNGSEIRLLPGASLVLYIKKKLKLDQSSKLNMNTGNPQLVWIQKMGHGKKGKVEVKNNSQLVAWIHGAKSELKVENDSEFFGSFAGDRVKVKENSRLHIDTAHIASCLTVADTPGEQGAASDEGITSADTFDQWFRDVLGVNMAQVHPITLIRSPEGVYEFLESGFFPIDDQLLGNEGGIHNDYFTYAITAQFTYEACGGQWLEFQGGDGTWIFIDHNLVVDLGGVLPMPTQIIELDRLGLEDGREYDVHIFYANRNNFSAVYRLRTNMLLSTDSVPTVTAMFD